MLCDMVNVERDSCWRIWRGVDLYAFVADEFHTSMFLTIVRWVFALFRQRGGGGDVIVVVLAVASRMMLQQVVAPNIIFH